MSIDKPHSFTGRTFAYLSIMYGIARFIVDFFRYYQGSAKMGVLTFNQILSLLLVAIGVVILMVQRKRQRAEPVA
jgi:prolipoprotein diacylglyceryltransferase